MDELRIAHLSDLHLGFINDLPHIRKIVRHVNRLTPDVVCITGDMFTESLRDVYDLGRLAEAFGSIKSRYGVYACLGNHDSGRDYEAMLSFFAVAGIRLLIDEVVVLDGGIALAGRDDPYSAGRRGHVRQPIEVVMADVDQRMPVILLDHQPGAIAEARGSGIDLMLSGHTHGGQFYPIHLLVRRIYAHYRGCKRFGDMWAVVSPGTCMSTPPMRIGSHSEVIEVRLIFEKTKKTATRGAAATHHL